MKENSNGKTNIAVIIIIIAIIVAVGIGFFVLCSKGKNGIIGNKALKVLETISFQEYEDEKILVLKVKNKSKNAFVNVNPILTYYDKNNKPIKEGWGARISFFAPNETRYIEIYDSVEDYGKAVLELVDRDDNVKFVDVRDKISYEVTKASGPDEDGMIRLNFKGENKHDKDVSVEFQIAYYSKHKLIYEDSFITAIDANAGFETYEEYATKYYDGTSFPDGYTYEVTLAEAVEYIDDYSEENSNVFVIEDKTTDMNTLNDEEKVEHAVHQLLKNSYGDQLDSAKIYVDKIYSKDEIENDDAIKSLNVGESDIAFEVSINILPVDGADINQFMISDGEYNKETGWVGEIHRLGILRYNATDNIYSICNYGTGW